MGLAPSADRYRYRCEVSAVAAAAAISDTNGSSACQYAFGSAAPPGHGDRRLAGMWVCSGTNRDSKPLASASRASTSMRMAKSVANMENTDLHRILLAFRAPDPPKDHRSRMIWDRQIRCDRPRSGHPSVRLFAADCRDWHHEICRRRRRARSFAPTQNTLFRPPPRPSIRRSAAHAASRQTASPRLTHRTPIFPKSPPSPPRQRAPWLPHHLSPSRPETPAVRYRPSSPPRGMAAAPW